MVASLLEKGVETTFPVGVPTLLAMERNFPPARNRHRQRLQFILNPNFCIN